MAILRAGCLAIFCLLALLGSVALAQSPAATVVAVQGTVFVISAQGERRILAADSVVNPGDRISTTRQASVSLRFFDGSQLVLQPSSSYEVKAFQFEPQRPEQDQHVGALLRGGLRAVSGLIGRRGDVDAYRLEAGTATVGIRGTEFSAQLCDADCNDLPEGASDPATVLADAELIGLRAEQEANLPAGRVLSAGAGAMTSAGQMLAAGAVLRVGDEVQSGDAALSIVLRDGSRMTLPPQSTLVIEAFSSQSDGATEDRSILSLLRGGLRYVTGEVGGRSPEAVQIRTPTATVGIRGTRLDLLCPAGLCGTGVWVRTREGLAWIRNQQDGTERDLPAGTAAAVTLSPGVLPLGFATGWESIDAWPVPESERVDLGMLFGLPDWVIPEALQGPVLLLTVHAGVVRVGEGTQFVELQAGESLATHAGLGLLRLRVPPPALLLASEGTELLMPFRAGMCFR